ncbi:MAG: hypothetical protein RID91_13165 [Azospirillaceae bacterium]
MNIERFDLDRLENVRRLRERPDMLDTNRRLAVVAVLAAIVPVVLAVVAVARAL